MSLASPTPPSTITIDNSSSLNLNSPSVNAHSHHHHLHHRGRRLRHFLLPDGKKVHVAISPEEAASLRQRLAAIEPCEAFDLVLSGSAEHLEAVRVAHGFHEKRRDGLKEKLGSDFDEFEHVRAQLDVLGSELSALTEGGVSLDANFSKYGYSAHLRTYDDGGSGTPSARSSISDDSGEKRNWEAEKRNGRILKIYKKPTVRQYFHKGLLWRASDQTEVASFELFVDLLYVGILAINGDHASEDPTGQELLRFAITFIMSWKLWSDLALIISWFETDDILQRISVLFIMTCLLGLTTNMLDIFHSTYSQLVAFYLTARLFMGCYCLLLGYLVPMVRGMLTTQAIITVIPSIVWIGSIHVDMPNRIALIWIAIFLDHILPPTVIAVVLHAKRWNFLSRIVERHFEFYPAMNIEHRTERTNAFVTLVFGYSVVAIIYQNAAGFGLNAFFGKAALGLLQAFCFNWIYFELDGADLYNHAIRRSTVSAMVWSTAHLPFVMSFVLAAAALSKLVLATDCAGTNVETLLEVSIERSEHEIPIGLRWFYCVGLGLALLCMGCISLSHIHKDGPAGFRIKKRHRLANRFVVCIIFFCLPTATSLNSLQLISVTTGLVVWVLVLELWGMSCPNESFFGEKKQCRYVARCNVRKKDLEAAVKGGHVVKVQTLSGKGEKGVYHPV